MHLTTPQENRDYFQASFADACKKRTLAVLTILALSLVPALAAEWELVGTTDAVYVGQKDVEQTTGDTETEFVLAGTLGFGVWRKTPFPINIGARLELAAIPDEQSDTPHIAAGASLMFGNDIVHGSVGTLLDQDEWLFTVSVGATF